MTEAEWLVATRPAPMLEFLREKADDRKLRLFAVACCRRVESMLLELQSRAALECAEEFAEGQVTQGERRATYQAIERYADGFAPYEAVMAALHRRAFFAANGAAVSAADAIGTLATPPLTVEEVGGVTRTRRDEFIQQAWLLRDIFGNPFRPVSFSPEWRTSTAIAIARGMYDSREFSAMPILADALQDAGCDNPDILSHCRDPNQVHVRGCWVVDLALGKE